MPNDPVMNPAEMHPRFAAAFNAGDLDALVRFYETDGAIAPAPGLVLAGHEGIRTALSQFMGGEPVLEMITERILENNGLAMLQGRWTLRRADGSQMSGRNREVIRKQADGSWLFVLDDPGVGE
jgi:uncharacterized protein (TIGR02246 family)